MMSFRGGLAGNTMNSSYASAPVLGGHAGIAGMGADIGNLDDFDDDSPPGPEVLPGSATNADFSRHNTLTRKETQERIAALAEQFGLLASSDGVDESKLGDDIATNRLRKFFSRDRHVACLHWFRMIIND